MTGQVMFIVGLVLLVMIAFSGGGGGGDDSGYGGIGG